MDVDTLARYEARARILKALAHPTRLFILEHLGREGEKCVCELTQLIGADMSTVSRHLAILKGAGILECDKRGSQVYYRLRMQCVLDFLECVESVLQCNAKDQQRMPAR